MGSAQTTILSTCSQLYSCRTRIHGKVDIKQSYTYGTSASEWVLLTIRPDVLKEIGLVGHKMKMSLYWFAPIQINQSKN